MTPDDGTDRGDSSGDDDSDGYVHTPGGDASDAGEDPRGYVHTPDGVERKGGERTEAAAERKGREPTEAPAAAGTTNDRPADATTTAQQAVGGTGKQDVVHPDAVEREFDWRGWILVGVLFVAFVVAPLTIYFVPPGAEHYFTVLIVMPLVPALLLAIVAVWATTRP